MCHSPQCKKAELLTHIAKLKSLLKIKYLFWR